MEKDLFWKKTQQIKCIENLHLVPVWFESKRFVCVCWPEVKVPPPSEVRSVRYTFIIVVGEGCAFWICILLLLFCFSVLVSLHKNTTQKLDATLSSAHPFLWVCEEICFLVTIENSRRLTSVLPDFSLSLSLFFIKENIYINIRNQVVFFTKSNETGFSN